MIRFTLVAALLVAPSLAFAQTGDADFDAALAACYKHRHEQRVQQVGGGATFKTEWDDGWNVSGECDAIFAELSKRNAAKDKAAVDAITKVLGK